jgi:acyl-CoA reductase-like NAD-dependent aldehyde dehydrogenase
MVKNNEDKLSVDEDILDIDKMALDEEWVEQPKLYFRYAKALAEQRDGLDEMKAELELTKAEVESDVRENPDKHNLPKVTEKAVENAVIQSTEYQATLRRFNKRKKRVALLSALVEALDQRKRALEKLVDLQTMEYFSAPRASNVSREHVEEANKRRVRNKGKD